MKRCVYLDREYRTDKQERTTESAYEFKIYQEDNGDLIIHIKACDQSDFFLKGYFC